MMAGTAILRSRIAASTSGTVLVTELSSPGHIVAPTTFKALNAAVARDTSGEADNTLRIESTILTIIGVIARRVLSVINGKRAVKMFNAPA